MNVGRYIFRQFVDYVPRYQIDKFVAKYHGDWHVKDLTCYNQWVAIIAYLLVVKIKADNNSPYSITEVATLIRVFILERKSLRELITKTCNSVIQNQSVKELSLFDNV